MLSHLLGKDEITPLYKIKKYKINRFFPIDYVDNAGEYEFGDTDLDLNYGFCDLLAV